MTGKKGQYPRKKQEIERDMVEVAELYVKGYPQQKIADILNQRHPGRPYNYTRDRVKDDLYKVRERWIERAVASYDTRMAEELAKLDMLEAEYWEAWEESKQPKKTQTAKKRQRPGEQGMVTMDEEARSQIEHRNGDPRYLEGIERCIKQRMKLLGLGAPQRIALVDWRKESKEIGVDPDRLLNEATERFEQMMRESMRNGGRPLPEPREIVMGDED